MRERAWVLGWVTVGLLLAFYYSEAVTSVFGTRLPDPDANYCEASRESGGRNSANCVQLRTAIATEAQAQYTKWGLWLLGLTFVATFIAARATWHTVHTVRDTSAQQLRAYVSGGGAFIARWVRDPKTDETRLELTDTFQVTVNNYGATPAHVSDVDVGFCNSNAIPPVPEYTQNVLIGGVIPPGKEGAPTAARFTRDQIKGDVIFGRFQYTDVYKATARRSGFILQITDDRDVMPINAPSTYTDWE
jgi:hypothetical protein